MTFKAKKFLKKASALSMIFTLAFSSVVSAEDSETNETENLSATVYIVGDSTACEYGYDENYAIPRSGWGMYLDNFLPDTMKVVNLALGGRSSKSFTTEENYTFLKENLKAGDYLLIQFGHNDEKKSTEEDLANRYTDPEGDINTPGSFKNSLYENYIKPARDIGAAPVLISPVSRRKFDENGKVINSHAPYDNAVRELAKETNAPFIDMTQITEILYNDLGPELTKLFHAAYKDKEKGLDNTHFNSFGAYMMANLIQNNIPFSYAKEINRPLTRGEFIEYLMRAIGETETADIENFKDISSDYEYANSIVLAKKAGIASGDENSNFRPDENIKPYDAVVFSMRALRYKGIEYPHTDISSAENYSIPSYALQDCLDLCQMTKDSSNFAMGKLFMINFEKSKEKETDYFLNALSDNHIIIFAAKDMFLIPIYETISETEKVETVEQNLNDLEKVE